ncbi:GNAT family protein [Pontibacter korlensis]|uniref:N-acetyltransferase domain-containing protein n=1 Tax=Pontibacter korlensis TaxID=400092 RepID=A0A0E3ZEJ3_9BACT|nr:GNAT family protein [Pontibacter korlensis]AKD02933.1 hypothetical protein PKOR_07080 [Pontibacter korlensis]
MILSHPSFTTERLSLRLIEPADEAFILQGLSDVRVTEFYAVHYNTLEEVQEQMKFYADLIQRSTGMWWAFSLKSSGELIGACGLNNLEQEHQKAEIGYWLLPAYWGKGYVPEAARVLLNYGFGSLGLNRVEAIVEAGNTASERVLQKLGFTYEGRLREREIQHGHPVDLMYYGLSKKEWM